MVATDTATEASIPQPIPVFVGCDQISGASYSILVATGTPATGLDGWAVSCRGIRPAR